MRLRAYRLAILLLATAALAACTPTHQSVVAAPHAPRVLPGWTPEGTVLLPNQWSLKPAGRQLRLGDLPLNMAFSPDGRYLAVTHGGYGPHELVMVALPENLRSRERIVSRVPLANLWYGLAWSPAGDRLYASGSIDDVVYQFDFRDGYLFNRRTLDFYQRGRTRACAGLALSADGRTLYVANNRDHSVGVVNLAAATPEMQPIALPADAYPYTCLPAKDGRTLYVSLWGRAEVAEVDLAARAVRRTIPTGEHPNELLLSRDGRRLFVSNASLNTVSVINTESGRVEETLSASLYPNSPPGSTPNALALSPAEDFLLVANADNNNLAVFARQQGQPTRSAGFIPVGWYPTSVRVHPTTSRIFVANGKGESSLANPQGPRPGRPTLSTTQYIAGLFTGTLGMIDWPDGDALKSHTRVAFQCSPYRGDVMHRDTPAEPGPIPRRLGEPSPIRHCLYIIKENRTYDQVLGDLPQGNGDPQLCLFPEQVTPNIHALAREFVLLDNFYVESEVSADGHEWSTGAYATDFVEKTWPSNYGHSGRSDLGYPAEGAFGIARPASGYIWDRCAEAGLSYRSYGEFIAAGTTDKDPAWSKVKTLEGHFDPHYRPWDLAYSDVDRAKRFIEELRGFEAAGEMPRFIVMHLPNDHTAGGDPSYPTPTAMVAQNDLALGMIVEALSHSRFWKELAIFVVEDDAQNGSDHVDAHRTEALVISPWCKRGAVDSSMYSTSSMLRTMELILGLAPMSQYDAAARPMYASFAARLDGRPFACRPAGVDIGQMNAATAWGAGASRAMDFSREDAADDLALNEIIWKNVRGPESAMPPPVRAAFVFTHADKHEDDD